MGFKIQGDTSNNIAEVDTLKQQKVTLPQNTSDNVGLAGVAAVIHDGVAGAARLVRAGEVTINRRLRAGSDNLLFQDVFSYAAQNTAVWANTLTTMTVAFTGGFIQLNSGASTASGAVARMTTYKFFPLFNGMGLEIEFDVIVGLVPATNNVIELGLFQATGTTAPTDGVFFRYTSAGNLVGVVNYNGTETTTANLTVPSAAVMHQFMVRVEQEETSFWVDGVLLASLTTPTTQNGPCQCMYQPINVREYNSAVASAGQTIKVGQVRLFARDVSVNRTWELIQADVGGMGSQGQNGGTMGTTALYTNSLAVGAGAAATNTTAALGSGLGGQFALQPTLAAGTDGIISSFQVPAGTAAVPGKSLVINGVKISGVVTSAFTGGPLIGLWSLAYGHTAVSMATTETATTKAPRRIALGIQVAVVTAAVGALASPELVVNFKDPIVVNPGEFVATVLKNAGTVTSAGVIAFLITFDAHWQ